MNSSRPPRMSMPRVPSPRRRKSAPGPSLENPFTQALKYLLWGEGETGILVYEILVRYWHSTDDDDVRPYIFLVSD